MHLQPPDAPVIPRNLRTAPVRATRSKKIVFFFPSFTSDEATAPLGILAVATPLLRAGYEVRVIDSTIMPDFEQRVLEELSDALCLAISLVTGPMIRETVAIARAAKQLYPEKPVILGGWHPSLLPDQTLAASYIDMIVVGQGEEAFLEVVRHIEAGEPPRGIAGVGYKQDGQLVFNPRRELRPLADLPPKAYHIADFDAYEKLCGRRWAMYVSSLACPFNCGYCTNEGVYGRKWNALDPRQASEEMCDLASRYRLQLLWVVDDNFLVDRDRALQIAEGIVARGTRFEWSIQASTNLVTRLSVEEWRLMRRAGLTQVAQGADSGSPKVLHLMNKDFQKLDTIYEAARLLSAAGIRPSFNMIFGYPGEGPAERRESIQLIMRVCREYPGAEFWTNIFTPYPGAPVMSRAFELGLDLPKRLEEWADFFPKYTVLPWLKDEEHARVQAMRDYIRVAFRRVNIGRFQKGFLAEQVYRFIRGPARWRLDHDFYAFPFEVWLKRAVDKLPAPAEQPSASATTSEAVAC